MARGTKWRRRARSGHSQINASSAVIFIIGDKTAFRTGRNVCKRQAKLVEPAVIVHPISKIPKEPKYANGILLQPLVQTITWIVLIHVSNM